MNIFSAFSLNFRTLVKMFSAICELLKELLLDSLVELEKHWNAEKRYLTRQYGRRCTRNFDTKIYQVTLTWNTDFDTLVIFLYFGTLQSQNENIRCFTWKSAASEPKMLRALRIRFIPRNPNLHDVGVLVMLEDLNLHNSRWHRKFWGTTNRRSYGIRCTASKASSRAVKAPFV